jgi:ABC-type multidrug transport system fused ATPase/permease subunit
MGAFEQLMEINSDLQHKEVFKSYFEQKKEIMKNENLKIRKKELEKLEEKYFKKVTKIGDENIVVGCLNNVIHKFLCFLPDEKLQALIIGTYDELKATEIMLKRHRSDVLTGKGDVYIGFNKFFQKVKPILIEIQKKIGHVNNEKILEMISGSIEKEIQRIQLTNVSFKYFKSGENILKGINISIKRGEKIAIVGKTGCGKSTLIKLILQVFLQLTFTLLFCLFAVKYNYVGVCPLI